MDNLDSAIRKLQLVIWRYPEASKLDELALKLSERYDLTGNIDDLEQAIDAAQESVDSTPEGHSCKADRLNTLANLVSRLCKKTDDPEEAIRLGREAVDSTSEGHSSLAESLDTLAKDDPDEAIRLAREAVDNTPEGHPYLADRLDTLATLLSDRYKRVGKTDDLEEAIGLARQAVDITFEDDPDRARLLMNLADLLSDRYERKKRTDDPPLTYISTPVAQPGEPPDLDDDVPQELPEVYNRTGDARDLEEAIQLAQEAVDIKPENDPELPSMLCSLAEKLSDNYDRTGMVRYIKRAVKYARKAVDIAPDDDTDLPRMLNALSLVLVKRYDTQPKKTYLEDATRLLWKAVDITPEGDPALVALYNNLAGRLARLDTNASVEYSTKAFGCQNTRPLDRIRVARPAIQLLVDSGNVREAAVLAEKALNLLPLVCNRYLGLDDQQNAVLQTSGLASDACSILLRNGGDPGRAVEYLEYGRGLIIGYLIEGRGDVSELADKYQEEAKKFERLRSQASQSIDPREPLDVRQRLSQERDKAVAALESCLKVIRHIDGFDRFLLPPSADSLKEYAVQGPIVIVNVTSISSDALIILRSGIKHIHLPNFSAYNARTYRRILGLTWGLSRLIKAKEKPQQDYCKFRETLKGLWTDCVRLVFDELGFRSPKRGSDLPRIWWIGTGLAASLPFHAAGDHSADSAQNAFSRAISSYTPSIKALQYAREKAKVKPRNQSLLLVAMPKTPGADDLPGLRRAKRLRGSSASHIPCGY
jgi:tetratricopeptide (TPR) repeat protein